jgi:hypothetical protein
VSFYVSTAIYFLLHCDEWDRFVAPPRHKFVTGATLLQLKSIHCEVSMVFNICIIEFDKKLNFGIVFQVLEENNIPSAILLGYL